MVVSRQALYRELTGRGSFGELSVTGARSVLQRYSDAGFQTAKRRSHGETARFPRRKHPLVPVRHDHGTFLLDGLRVRLPVAKGRPALWVRLTRPVPYPAEHVRAVTLLADGGRLWLAVTAAVPVEQQLELDPTRVAGVDLGIIHPSAVVTRDTGLLISGRAIRAESYLHLRDRQARQVRAARRVPRPGQRGSRRWRRYRHQQRRAEARHRRRIYQAHHQAAKQAVAFAVQHRIGIQVQLVDERGTFTTCPACRQRVAKPKGRRFRCASCGFQGHRDLVGAHNIVVKAGGGTTSAVPELVEHRRAGTVPARRDRRRHLLDRRSRSCLASGLPDEHHRSSGCRSPGVGLYPAPDEDRAAPSTRVCVA